MKTYFISSGAALLKDNWTWSWLASSWQNIPKLLFAFQEEHPMVPGKETIILNCKSLAMCFIGIYKKVWANNTQ